MRMILLGKASRWWQTGEREAVGGRKGGYVSRTRVHFSVCVFITSNTERTAAVREAGNRTVAASGVKGKRFRIYVHSIFR